MEESINKLKESLRGSGLYIYITDDKLYLKHSTKEGIIFWHNINTFKPENLQKSLIKSIRVMDKSGLNIGNLNLRKIALEKLESYFREVHIDNLLNN